MNREQKPTHKIHILEAIWREICSYYPPEAGGQDRGAPLNPRLEIYPPQAVENRKIISVSLWRRMGHFSAGNWTGGKGKHFGSCDARI